MQFDTRQTSLLRTAGRKVSNPSSRLVIVTQHFLSNLYSGNSFLNTSRHKTCPQRVKIVSLYKIQSRKIQFDTSIMFKLCVFSRIRRKRDQRISVGIFESVYTFPLYITYNVFLSSEWKFENEEKIESRIII